MADSDVLRAYSPGSYPTIEGGEAKYHTAELAKLKTTLALVIQVIKELEVRIAAGGL